MKKSIFKASFEESLDLLDDGFLQYQKKIIIINLGKPLRKGNPLFGLVLKLLFLVCYFR